MEKTRALSTPSRYRKKPVVIEAIQLGSANCAEVATWCGGWVEKEQITQEVIGIIVHTKEGLMHGRFGDWIIKGIQGEFYPCKPDIFAASYEPVAESG